MKRTITLFLSLIMLLSLTMTSYAEEYVVESMQGYGQTEILAHIYSRYTITIPATINLSETNQGTIAISGASLEEGYQVKVFCTNINSDCNGIILYNVNDNSKTIPCAILDENGLYMNSSTPLATFTLDDITSYDTIRNFQLELMSFDAVAGDYMGIAEYSFDCSPM